MLSLSRQDNQGIVITAGSDEILIKPRIVWDSEQGCHKMRVCIEAPKHVTILRDELLPHCHRWARQKPLKHELTDGRIYGGYPLTEDVAK